MHIAAGTKHKTALMVGGSYDDNTYTINDPPAWLKYCGALVLADNGHVIPFGITTTGEQIKFNRRDTKMTDLYREDGTLYNLATTQAPLVRLFVHNQLGAATDRSGACFHGYRSFMIHAVIRQATTVLEAAGMTYTKPTVETPYVFSTLDEECTEYEIRYDARCAALPAGSTSFRTETVYYTAGWRINGLRKSK